MPIIIDENGRREVTDSEYATFMQSLNSVWNKEVHISEISRLHDELFNSILDQHNYTSFAELTLWAQEPTNEYYTEANAIKEWYRSTWMEIKTYSETVTEGTAVEPQTFIDNLEPFTV